MRYDSCGTGIPSDAKPSRRVSWGAILQTAVAMLLFSLNHIAAMGLGDRDYTPFSVGPAISPLVYDETQYYCPPARKFMESSSVQTEVDVYELRGSRHPRLSPLPTIVLGTMARVLGGVETAWMAAHAIFPALAWLLCYSLLRACDLTRVTRSLVAWVTVLVSFGPRNFSEFFEWNSNQPLELTRTPNPAISFVILVCALICTNRALASRTRRSVVLAGVVAGLEFYAYYFYWVGISLALASWSFVTLVMGRRDVAGRLLAVLVVACLTGAASWLPALTELFDPTRSDTATLLRGTFHDRRPSLAGLALIAFGMLGILWTTSRNAPAAADAGRIRPAREGFGGLFACLAGAGGGLNLQLLTGVNAQHDHYFNRLVQPIGCLLSIGLVCSIVSVGPRIRRRLKTAACVVIALMWITSAHRQVSVGLETRESHRRSSPGIRVLDWIERNCPPDSVLATTDPKLIELSTVFTGMWTFVPVGGRTVATDTEILTRYLALSYLEDKSIDDVVAALLSPPPPRGPIGTVSYTLFWSEEAAPWVAKARELWARLDPAKELAARRLDFVLLLSSSVPHRLLTQFPRAHVVHSNERWSVWALAPPA